MGLSSSAKANASIREMMNNANQNNQIIQKFSQVVWEEHNLEALKHFWTEDCINHAVLKANNQSLNSLQV